MHIMTMTLRQDNICFLWPCYDVNTMQLPTNIYVSFANCPLNFQNVRIFILLLFLFLFFVNHYGNIPCLQWYYLWYYIYLTQTISWYFSKYHSFTISNHFLQGAFILSGPPVAQQCQTSHQIYNYSCDFFCVIARCKRTKNTSFFFSPLCHLPFKCVWSLQMSWSD